MKLTIPNIINTKKVLVIALRQTNNNLYCTISRSSFKENRFSYFVKQRFSKLKKRLPQAFFMRYWKKKQFKHYKNFLNTIFLDKKRANKIIKKFKKANFNRGIFKITQKIRKKRILTKYTKWVVLLRKNMKKSNTIKLANNKKQTFVALKQARVSLKKNEKKAVGLSKFYKKYKLVSANLKKPRAVVSEFYKLKKRKTLLAEYNNTQNYSFIKSDFQIPFKAFRNTKKRILYSFLKAQRFYFNNYKDIFSNPGSDLFNTLAPLQGLMIRSNGSTGNIGPMRQLPFAAEKLGLLMGRFIKKKKFRSYNIIILLQKPLSSMTRAFFRGFKIVRPNIHSIIPKFKISHGRIRRRKSRRV